MKESSYSTQLHTLCLFVAMVTAKHLHCSICLKMFENPLLCTSLSLKRHKCLNITFTGRLTTFAAFIRNGCDWFCFSQGCDQGCEYSTMILAVCVLDSESTIDSNFLKVGNPCSKQSLYICLIKGRNHLDVSLLFILYDYQLPIVSLYYSLLVSIINFPTYF